MFKDPDLPWPSEYPYDRLNRSLQDLGHPGLDPSWSENAVKDLLFDLMVAGRENSERLADRQAWDDLRHTERRLFTDFFMYSFPGAGIDDFFQDLERRPIPIHTPDFRNLGQIFVRREKLMEPPPFHSKNTPPIPIPLKEKPKREMLSLNLHSLKQRIYELEY